jgi:SAM-dependent methyltransferase
VNAAAYYEKVRKWRESKGVDLALMAECLSFHPNWGFRDMIGIDFGCADGDVQAALMTAFPSLRMIGYDANGAAVASGQQIGRKVFLVGPNGLLPNNVLHAHFVTCLSTLSHLPDPAASIRSMCRRLRKFGLLIVETPEPWYDRILAPKLWLSGYRGDPTIRAPISLRALKKMTPPGMTLVYAARTGRRLPGFLSRFSLRSDYVAVFRKDSGDDSL